MHGNAPKLMIIAKKEAMGEGCPDFSGDSYIDAKKKMIHEDESPDSAHMEEMRDIATKLHECADRLQEMTGESGEDSEDSEESKDSEESNDGSYGESVELE
jgi:hypothetical protein